MGLLRASCMACDESISMKVSDRDRDIFARWLAGDSQTELSARHSVTPARIWQIVGKVMRARGLNAKECAAKHAAAARARGLKNVRDTYQGMDRDRDAIYAAYDKDH